jgi:hypothetical protein
LVLGPDDQMREKYSRPVGCCTFVEWAILSITETWKGLILPTYFPYRVICGELIRPCIVLGKRFLGLTGNKFPVNNSTKINYLSTNRFR